MKNFLIVGFCMLVLASCSNFQKAMKDPRLEARYEAGLSYYNDGDYYKAGLLFEDLLPQLIGTARAQDVQFYYAYTHYYQKQYELANYYFNSFYETYPRSPRAEEAYLMRANSLYFSTPAYNLDQSNTDDAIQAYQDFLNRYPDSEQFRDMAEARIIELQRKLEKKYFEIANLYYKRRRYKAAVVAFENFTRDFPDTELKEEALLLQLKSAYELADQSYYTVKEDRYQNVFDYYNNFIDRYPNSTFQKDATKIFDNARAGLVRHRADMKEFEELQKSSS
jgi:outer membrane protein assembly factor BamD